MTPTFANSNFINRLRTDAVNSGYPWIALTVGKEISDKRNVFLCEFHATSDSATDLPVRLPANDLVHRPRFHAVLTCKTSDQAPFTFAAFIQFAYFKNLFVRQFRKRSVLTPTLTILFHHVVSVIFLRTCKQMLWPNARRIIAFVKNSMTLRHWAKMNEPRRNVGENHPIAGEPGINTSIVLVVYRTKPNPAVAPWAITWRFINTAPKSDGKRLPGSYALANRTTVFLNTDKAGTSPKIVSTFLADLKNWHSPSRKGRNFGNPAGGLTGTPRSVISLAGLETGR